MVSSAQLITVLGPTACGKTAQAVELAAALDGEIISADSRQVFRRMDIGTGKDLADYVLPDGRSIPYHLIDICEPGERYSLYDFQRDFRLAYDDILARGRQPILCGGTGLYIESVLRGYTLSSVPANPALRETLEGTAPERLMEMLAELGTQSDGLDPRNPRRLIRAIEVATYQHQHGPQPVRAFPPVPSLTIGLLVERDVRRQRISQRLRTRLDEGMVDEVRSLLAEGIAPEVLIGYGLEYRYVTLHCLGRLTEEEMSSQLEIAIHQFAKRQMTYFRGMERRGVTIRWVDPAQQSLVETIQQL